MNKQAVMKFVFAFSILALGAPSFAQNAFGHINFSQQIEAALPGSLHDTMKAMSRALKSIDAEDASKNKDNAEAADQFVALVLHAKAFTPDSIADMPASKRSDAKSRYDQMLDQTAALGRQLADAFRHGDNKKAADLMDQLDAAKKHGHGEFK